MRERRSHSAPLVHAAPLSIGRRVGVGGADTWNVPLQCGLLSALGLISFLTPTTDLSDRSDMIFSLMLTMTAFKFVISDSLPKVPYFTLLDICAPLGREPRAARSRSRAWRLLFAVG